MTFGRRQALAASKQATGKVPSPAKGLRSSLKRLNRVPDYFESQSTEGADLPGARSVLFRRMETFFNLNLYDFGVKVGPTKEVK